MKLLTKKEIEATGYTLKQWEEALLKSISHWLNNTKNEDEEWRADPDLCAMCVLIREECNHCIWQLSFNKYGDSHCMKSIEKDSYKQIPTNTLQYLVNLLVMVKNAQLISEKSLPGKKGIKEKFWTPKKGDWVMLKKADKYILLTGLIGIVEGLDEKGRIQYSVRFIGTKGDNNQGRQYVSSEYLSLIPDIAEHLTNGGKKAPNYKAVIKYFVKAKKS